MLTKMIMALTHQTSMITELIEKSDIAKGADVMCWKFGKVELQQTNINLVSIIDYSRNKAIWKAYTRQQSPPICHFRLRYMVLQDIMKGALKRILRNIYKILQERTAVCRGLLKKEYVGFY